MWIITDGVSDTQAVRFSIPIGVAVFKVNRTRVGLNTRKAVFYQSKIHLAKVLVLP